MLPSNSKRGRCENEAFVRGCPPISRVEDVTTCLRRSSSNAESVSTHAKHNSAASSKKRKSHLEPSVLLSAQSELEPATPAPVAHASLLFTAPEASFTRKNTMFRANPNIQMTSMMYKNAAFVRCFRHIRKVEAVKMTLSCEASVKFQHLKIRRRSFRAMLPSNSTSSRCENEAFVRCFRQIRHVSCVEKVLFF